MRNDRQTTIKSIPIEWVKATDDCSQLEHRLQRCLRDLALAEKELVRAVRERNLPAINRARVAVSRLRERKSWVASRLSHRAECDRIAGAHDAHRQH